MGQEISLSHFNEGDFTRFHQKLEQETLLLEKFIAQKNCSHREPVAGFEIEAWLVNNDMRPSPINKHYLATLNDPLASTELAKYNIEFNCLPEPLTGHVFSRLHLIDATSNNTV